MPAKPAKITRTDAEWRARLTPLQYIVTRRRGTERAFSGQWLDPKGPGSYACACCGARLFDASARLEDGAGWPSFGAPAAPQAIALEADNGWLQASIEALCARCDAHLGHALGEGAQRRFCINAAALRFTPAPAPA